MDVDFHTNPVTPFTINNPVLRYRLDPCEPGILKSAPASQSVAAVSAHERGNLSQFRREAALAGRMVVQESITFTRGVDGLFTSIRAGRTEVVSVPLPEDDVTQTREIDKPETSQPQPEVKDIVDTDKNISEDELELLTILSTIRRQLEENQSSEKSTWLESPEFPPRAESNQGDSITLQPQETQGEESSPLPYSGYEDTNIGIPADHPSISPYIEQPSHEENHSQLKAEYARMQAEMRDVQHKLNEVMIRRLSANISQLNELLSGVISQNVNMASKLVQVVNHIGPYSHSPDLSSETPLLGAALDFSA